MSLEKFWGNSKSSEKKEKTPFSYSRHPIIKKKKSKYLLTTSSPFRPSYTPSPENEKDNEIKEVYYLDIKKNGYNF